jgi:uncharacterized protein YndB with AHSA1/START domain
MPAKNNSDTLHLTRIYDAPVKSVWEAWTDPKQLAKWWGPRGFTITTHHKDEKTWDYTMHGPDGVDYPNVTVYHEIEKYKRMVYDHGGNKTQPPMFRVTVEFTELSKNKTKMDMQMAFASHEIFEESKKVIKKANGNSTWDRLAEYLDKETSGHDRFVINRSFQAPIETVFEMWTNPKHFTQWLPPTGFNMKFIEVDIKPGGTGFYMMSDAANTMKMYGKVNYIEIKKPDRLVYTQQFADEKGNLTRHPMSPTWPETMLTTITLASEGPDQTRVTVMWEPHGKVTAEEVATFLKERAGMTQGWTGSFDKLEDYLAKQ